MLKDTFLTLQSPTTGLYKDKGSKFHAYAYPVNSKEKVKEYIDLLKKEHHSARHHCFAYVIGNKGNDVRANDDGEPSNSAGKPILGQIEAKQLTNVLVVVVRYFGGTLLGVGGLIQAYKEATKCALDEGEIVEVQIMDRIKIHFAYNDMNNVMRVIKEEMLEIEQSKMELECDYIVLCRQSKTKHVLERLEGFLTLKVSLLD